MRFNGIPKVVVAATLALLAALTFGAVEEHCGVVTRVVDGDTFYVAGLPERVRLADVNAPELSTAEGQRAKAALEALLLGRRVCLDIDDLYKTDRYGRYVAVAYLDYNETHWLNVNQWLVERGYAEYRDYPNEFRPPWPLYVPKSATRTPADGVAHATVTMTHTVTTTVAITQTITTTVTDVRTVTATTTVTKPITETRIVTKREVVTFTTTVVKESGNSLYVLVAILAVLLVIIALTRLAIHRR